jgi:DNA polymerase-1
MIRTLLATKGNQKDIAILLPNKDLKPDQIKKYYVNPLIAQGVDKDRIICITIELNDQGKAPITVIKPCMEIIGKMFDKFGVTRVMVCQSQYFKYLTKKKKVEVHYGYPIKSPLLPNITFFASVTPGILFVKPAYQLYMDLSLKALAMHTAGKSNMFVHGVLKDVEYPSRPTEISQALADLHLCPALTCDTETYSLQVDKAGIGTIAFAWNQTDGIAFQPDLCLVWLRVFLESYKGKLIYHNAPFDIKVLIWKLFMDHPTDYVGMLHGLDVLFRDMDDTKILTYLAVNSTTGNELKLKQQAFEYAGNYAADDIDDITKIPLPELLEYNLTDAVCTWYVYNKYRATVRQDQEDIYQNIFKPALKVITQMELVGMPLNMPAVEKAEYHLQLVTRSHMDAIQKDPIITAFMDVMRETAATEHTARLKKKIITVDDYADLEFNPGSPKQMRMLLFEHLELPKQSTTHTGLASTDDKTLQRLVHTSEVKALPNVAVLIDHIAELSKAAKILDTFIPAFLNKNTVKDGWHYLMGSFNLGGTITGRLSSSNPNLMNIPATGTKYAKLVKRCFQAPPGWILVGADFSSLEDRISALQTNDPNKIKIYTDGYDGHCLRAYAYLGDQMSDIELALSLAPDIGHPAIINSIAVKYPNFRQDSKSPTFALTYKGTSHTLMKNFGFSEEEAKTIEDNYHKLYKVSDDWVDARIEEAGQSGYLTLAFGLRLRTPVLLRVVLNSGRKLPREAQKEIKTAGNALGQSYGLLNSRAANEFMQRVWDSERRYDVLPIAQIHDSLYFIQRNSLPCLQWVNNNLIECMEWNKLAEIQHPVVGLEAELEVYHPTWAESATVPNKANQKTLRRITAKLQT